MGESGKEREDEKSLRMVSVGVLAHRALSQILQIGAVLELTQNASRLQLLSNSWRSSYTLVLNCWFFMCSLKKRQRFHIETSTGPIFSDFGAVGKS